MTWKAALRPDQEVPNLDSTTGGGEEREASLSLASRELRDGGVEIVVVGDIDIATGPELERYIISNDRGGDVTLDLSQVAFIDSWGLRVLVAAHRRAERNGQRLILCDIQPIVRRVLEISGLAGFLNIIESN